MRTHRDMFPEIRETESGCNHAAYRHPGKLWSLWDMITLNAGFLFRLAQAAQGMRDIANNRALQSPIEKSDGSIALAPIKEQSTIGMILDQCTELEILCRGIGADISLREVERLIKRVESHYKPTWSDVLEAFTCINGRLQDELDAIVFVSLNSDDRKYYNPKTPLFGADFENKFQTNGAFELDEAAKCRALARPTAAVFHLMRVMEVGIRAMARCLNVPDPLKPAERNWGRILENIKSGIDAKWPPATVRAGDGVLFEELYASLDAVKNPWRNGTMHVEKKYTDDEAEHIFVAVKGFMKKLAARCDEDGNPKA